MVDIDTVTYEACALEMHALPEWVKGVLHDSSPAGLNKIAGIAARMADLLGRAAAILRLADTKCYGIDCARCKWERDPAECDVFAMEQALREWRGDAGSEDAPARIGGQHAHAILDRWEVYRKSDGAVIGVVETKSVHKAITVVAEEHRLDRSLLSARSLLSRSL